MRNKYAELFKDVTEQNWKILCDACLSKEGIRKYYNMDIPSNVINYYENKFNYKCPMNSRTVDERGNKYDRLTVFDYYKDNNDTKNGAKWLCRCECGNVVIRTGLELRRSRTTHHMCQECLKKEVSKRMWKDLTGQTINQLLVLERIGNSSQGNVIYKCKCLNCGKTLNVNSLALNSKKPQIACGCTRASKGEIKIEQLLQEMNIEYKTQFSFPDCCYIKPLRFDFAVFKNNELKALIEYQGQQHYECLNNPAWEDNQEKFTARLIRDKIKQTFCEKNNIPLILIPYYDYYKLNQNYLDHLFNDIFNIFH